MNNIIESYTGTWFTWSDSAINNGITGPIFTWLGSLVNAVLKFWPIFVFVAFFCLMCSLFFSIGEKKKDKKNKSLENK